VSPALGGSLAAVLGLAYLGIGVGVAWDLGRRGHGIGVTASALPCWPLLLGLVGSAPPPPVLLEPTPRARGPHAARIDACLRALGAGLREVVDLGGAPLIDAAQLQTLGDALDRVDLRIARVDQLLAEAEAEAARAQFHDPAVDAAVATLRGAREHAQRELDGVLSGLLQLRVQLGLFTLAGEAEPVRERLAEIEARIVALAQLASVELAQVRS
jgi:hypothetical protein